VESVLAYADASLLVALFLNDQHSAKADRLLRSLRPSLVVSDFGTAEFSSAISLQVRAKRLTSEEALDVLLAFDQWAAQETLRVEATHADIAAATALLRRFNLMLRTPDAVNIAIVQRIAAQLLTFDKKMAEAARALGVDVVAV
jgi:predicted nucleic acid-binding protein